MGCCLWALRSAPGAYPICSSPFAANRRRERCCCSRPGDRPKRIDPALPSTWRRDCSRPWLRRSALLPLPPRAFSSRLSSYHRKMIKHWRRAGCAPVYPRPALHAVSYARVWPGCIGPAEPNPMPDQALPTNRHYSYRPLSQTFFKDNCGRSGNWRAFQANRL